MDRIGVAAFAQQTGNEKLKMENKGRFRLVEWIVEIAEPVK
jgi:hypothetical protein